MIVAESAHEQRMLWAFRESMTDAIAEVVSGARVALFGQFSEGNFPISVLPPKGSGNYPEDIADAIEDAVLALVVAADGTISAEHGVGRAKQRWLRRQRGDSQYELMKQIKSSFDPQYLLNPGVLFPNGRTTTTEEETA